MAITSTVAARVGLLGNPSDAFCGAAISLAIDNFAATVSLDPNEHVHIVPNEEHDLCKFSSISALQDSVAANGYYGGHRLLLATCKMFNEECRSRGIKLPAEGFTLSYTTTIPRQLGLSGSSAIICAAFNCLLEWYGVQGEFPVPERPGLILAVETEELGMTAGLMDRVSQVYGGLVFMDLSAAAMKKGHGDYTYLSADALPPLWLIYTNIPSSSSKMHSPVKQRWLDGDQDVVSGMKELAELAKQGRELIGRDEGRIADDLASLMDQNFAVRRRVYGDEALGERNLEMLQTAKGVGASAKFCGSGGCVLALCPGGEDQSVKLLEACMERTYICEKVKPSMRLFETVEG